MPWRYINAEVIHNPWNQLVVYNHWTGMVEWNNGTAIALFSRSKVTYKGITLFPLTPTVTKTLITIVSYTPFTKLILYVTLTC